jgi:hypothetical protein
MSKRTSAAAGVKGAGEETVRGLLDARRATPAIAEIKTGVSVSSVYRAMRGEMLMGSNVRALGAWLFPGLDPTDADAAVRDAIHASAVARKAARARRAS